MLSMHKCLRLFLCSILARICVHVYADQYAPVPVQAQDYRGQTLDAELIWDADRSSPLVRVSTGEEFPLEQFRQLTPVRLRASQPHGLPWFELRFWGAERLSVQQIAGNDRQLQATLAGAAYTFPTRAIAQLSHYGAARPIMRASFDQGLPAGIELRGQARLLEGRGVDASAGVEFKTAGDELRLLLSRPLAEGTVQLLLHDPGPEALRFTLLVELEFQRGNQSVRLQVVLVPGREFWGFATPEGPPSAVEPVSRRQGWNRVRFTVESNRIGVDVNGMVLSVIHQPVGRLVQLRVAAQASEEPQDTGAGAPAYVDDVQIYERLPAMLERQPAKDQDEVLLYDGQQFYGTVRDLSPEGVALQADTGTLRFPWDDVYAVFFSPGEAVSRLLKGQRARVIFAPAADSLAGQTDNLEAIITGLSDQSIELDHPLLGKVSIPLGNVARLLPGRYGYWLMLDPRFHHLGDEVDLNLQRPYPEGNQIRWSFELASVPEQVWFVADVVDLEPMQEGAPYYQQLRDGYLRTELLLNGKTVDFLNRHVPLGNRRQPRRVRIELPRAELRAGRNTLELRQQPQKDLPGSYDDFGIFAVSLEWSPEK